MSAAEIEPVEEWLATKADPVNVFYIQWAEETLKKNLQYLNESLQRLVTLNTAMIAGGLLLTNNQSFHPGCRNASIVLFLISLLVALVGSLPRRNTVHMLDASAIRQHKDSATRTKWTLLVISYMFLFLGFVVAFVGLV